MSALNPTISSYGPAEESEEVYEARHISVKDELLAIIKRPVYVLTILGYAANTGMMIGVSTFGSALLLEFG